MDETLREWAPGGIVAPVIAGVRDDRPADRTIPVTNPATGDTLAEVVAGDDAHIDSAVAVARDAQREWIGLAPNRRGDAMLAWSTVLTAHSAELARLDSLSMGYPFAASERDAPGTIGRMRYWAGLTDKINGIEQSVVPGHLSYTRRDPLGVVGVITPWNGPISSFVNRVSAALACGNAVVVKPSEIAPLSAIRMTELATAAGLPAGLVNVIPGDGATGAALIRHPDVSGISFTGSVATGRRVAAAAGESLTQAVLELGGKSPSIVFDDADLDEAVRGSVWGVFHNSGQACVAGTRLLVHRPIVDEFVGRVVALGRRVVVGDPFDPASRLGPLAFRGQYEKVMDYLSIARDEGASVALGGGRPVGLEDAPGYYVAPTVLLDVDRDARVANEEIFGPVLSVLPFDDEQDALRLANAVEYGLSAAIWTRDAGRLLRMADQLECGTIFGNTARLLHPALAFGGFKNSGIGNASGQGAIEGNTRLKRVSIRYGLDAPSPGWDL